MSGIPSWEGFRVKKVPTSDSKSPKQEVGDREQTVYVEVCKICRKPLAENLIVCSRCGHYVCEEHCKIYQMATLCHLCIVEIAGVDKRCFKVLYGFVHEYGKRRIKKAGKFTDAEFESVLSKLATAKMIERKSFLGLFEMIDATSLALETMPVLESIYDNELETDVGDFIYKLGQSGALLGNIGKISITPKAMLFFGVSIEALGIISYVSARLSNSDGSLGLLAAALGFLLFLFGAVSRKRGAGK